MTLLARIDPRHERDQAATAARDRSRTGPDCRITPRDGVIGLRPGPGILRAAAVGTLASLCGVALTATSAWLIVQASTRPVILTLLTAIVCVRAFGIGRPVLRYAERLLSHDAALHDLVRRRVHTYRRLVPLTPVGLGRRSRGDLLAGAVHDLDDEVAVQVRAVVPLLECATVTLTTAGVAALILPPAGAVVLGLAVVTLTGFLLCARAGSRAAGSAVRARARTHEVTQLIVTGVPDLRAIHAEAQALQWLEEAQATLGRAIRAQSRVQAVSAGMPWATAAAATAAMAAVVHHAASSGPVSGPVAALLLLLPVALADVLGSLPDACEALLRGRAARTRLDRLLGRRTAAVAETRRDLPPHTPEIELQEVTAGWTGDDLHLGPVTARIAPGDHVGITGPNGAGKSTLLAVVQRHLAVRSGVLRFDGHDASALSAASIRRMIAVVDDEPHVFAATVRANLAVARPGAPDDQLVTALQSAGMGDWLARHSLDTLLGLGGCPLSGGERVRLAIARALLSGRPILLLDEPVAHLDRDTAQAVMRDLHRSARGRTVLVVSHQPDGLAQCHRVLRLGDQASVPAGRDTVLV